MRRVIIESPFAGEVGLNVEYARSCLRDSLLRGEAPIASHLLYPQVLDDRVRAEREVGIEAGLAWGRVADLTAVYVDRGISAGMRRGVARARAEGRPVAWRSIFGPDLRFDGDYRPDLLAALAWLEGPVNT